MAGGSWWREEDGRDRGGAFSAKTQEPELFLGTQVQEGMRDTSAAQITSGVCEGGSLLISERWGRICWHAEAAAAHSYIITCSSQAGSPVGTAQPIQQHVPGIQAKSSTFFSQNQDTDGLFKWPAILLIHTFVRICHMNDDKSCHWQKVLLVTPIRLSSFVDYCPKTEVFLEAMKLSPFSHLFFLQQNCLPCGTHSPSESRCCKSNTWVLLIPQELF